MRYLQCVCLLSLFMVCDSASAYFVRVSGQTLRFNDGNVVNTDLAETDGATFLSFDTGTVFGSFGGSARSFASANFATGELKTFALSSGGESVGGQHASAHATIQDQLTFDLPDGVVSSTVTVNLRIEGTVSGGINAGSLPQNLLFSGLNCAVGDSDSISLHDFISPHTLTASVTLTDGCRMQLNASIGGKSERGLIDLSNTASLSIVLEDGVGFTSASGVLLTAVPAPAAVWLFGSALGLLGWMRRKKAA